ncbi:hypothetical protein D7X33_21670 [Butyricicoccus sp. 1XD8-22]|nr:hypothetical protein D7X33_21670 [Butyricicoccus sp. 1XD8-22]
MDITKNCYNEEFVLEEESIIKTYSESFELHNPDNDINSEAPPVLIYRYVTISKVKTKSAVYPTAFAVWNNLISLYAKQDIINDYKAGTMTISRVEELIENHSDLVELSGIERLYTLEDEAIHYAYINHPPLQETLN